MFTCVNVTSAFSPFAKNLTTPLPRSFVYGYFQHMKTARFLLAGHNLILNLILVISPKKKTHPVVTHPPFDVTRYLGDFGRRCAELLLQKIDVRSPTKPVEEAVPMVERLGRNTKTSQGCGGSSCFEDTNFGLLKHDLKISNHLRIMSFAVVVRWDI